MKQEQVLKKAIRKAMDNGWSFDGWTDTKIKDWEVKDGAIWVENEPKKQGEADELWDVDFMATWSPLSYKDIIFDHDFAKAFFGKRKDCCGFCGSLNPNGEENEAFCCMYCQPCERWEWHLQHMVLEKNPLDYIAKFL